MSAFVKSIFKKPINSLGFPYPGESYTPPQPEAPVAPIDYAAQASAKTAAEKKRISANLAQGAASTILTGGMGIDEMPAVQRKQLFGQ